MKTDANIHPVTAEIIWQGDEGQTPYALLEHDGQSYTLRLVDGGVDIQRHIGFDNCFVSQVDTVDEALAFISLYASQLIDC